MLRFSFVRHLLLAVSLAGALLALVAQPAAAATPSVSPSVPTSLYISQMARDCDTEGEACSWCRRGYSCAIVYDAEAQLNFRKVFYFYKCRTYSVRDWRGWGSFVNNQTGGARTYLYDRNRRLLKSVPADSRLHFYDFEPVWYVKSC